MFSYIAIAVALAFTFLVAAPVLQLSALPSQAHADTLAAASTGTAKNKVVKVTAKERKAYNRAVAACMDYKHQPNPIVVDMSDLKLTKKQALRVGEMLHANGELFFINTYSDSSYGKKKFTLPCYYGDKKITAMRKKVNAAANKALKRIGPGMTAHAKVHMLHDYLINTIKYTDAKKDAYTGLVQRKADCFGYALSMDLLLRRAGFTTDMAFNTRLDHAWNLVKIGSSWFHVDVTFDAFFSKQRYSSYFDWKKKCCHLYLLQSDKTMSRDTVDPDTGITIDSHKGWTAHYKCTNTKYDSPKVSGAKGSFNDECKAYKSIVRSFKRAGLKYKVSGVKKVRVAAVSTKQLRQAKSIAIPATVTYKGVKYAVIGISAKAFANSNARTLKVSSAKFTATKVKNSLVDSKVKKIKLLDAAKKKKAAYKKYFKKSNSGKKITVTK